VLRASQPSQVEEIAAFLRQHIQTDKADLAQKLIERFPDLTGDELQAAIDTRRPTLVLSREGKENPASDMDLQA
jgi:hypothetical protein